MERNFLRDSEDNKRKMENFKYCLWIKEKEKLFFGNNGEKLGCKFNCVYCNF